VIGGEETVVAETLATEAGGTEAAVTEAQPLSLSSAVSSAVADHEADTDAAVDADGRAGTAPSTRTGPASEELLVQEGDVAGDYLERLLDLVDYDGDIDLDVEAGRAMVSIDGGEDLEKLVGPRGAVIEALQELTRLAVQQQTGARSRLMLDIAQWRSTRRSDLSELGRSTAERVRDGGEPARLQAMTPFERKIVHDAVAAVDGVHSESEGEEPRRRVVVFRSV
jgi:spoIIIJ-associated protein